MANGRFTLFGGGRNPFGSVPYSFGSALTDKTGQFFNRLQFNGTPRTVVPSQQQSVVPGIDPTQRPGPISVPTPDISPIGFGPPSTVQPTLGPPPALPMPPVGAGPIATGMAGPMGEEIEPTGVPAADAPKGFLGKIGGFLGRQDVGDSLLAAGSAMMQGASQPGGTFAGSLGAGIEAAQGAATSFAERDKMQAELEDRERALSGIERLKEGLTEEQKAAIDAVDPATGYTMAEQYRRDKELTDAFDKSGGHYITDEYEYDFVKGMEPEARNQWMLENVIEGKKGIAARTAGLIARTGMAPDVAAIVAQNADASARAMAGGREVEMIKDDLNQSYLINTATGEVVGGPYGKEGVDLDQARLDLARDQLDRNEKRDELNPLYTMAIKQYSDTREDTNALYGMTEAVNLINSEVVDDRFGSFETMRSGFQKIVDGDDSEASVILYLDNVLKDMGISNLSRFKGAISDRELATALAQAGTIDDMKDMLNAIVARNMRGKIRMAEQHNSQIKYLKDMGIDAAAQLAFNEKDLEYFNSIQRKGAAASGILADILGEKVTYSGTEEDLVPLGGDGS